MKKLICVLPFFLLFCCMAWAQRLDQFSVRMMGGKASYSMAGPKSMYYAYNRNLGVKPQVTDDFPPYYYYELQAFYRPVPAWKVGLSYGATSTGARVTYSDYSGAYYFDQWIKCREFGALAQYRLGKRGGFSFNSGLSLTAIFTDYAMEERLQVYEYEEGFYLAYAAVGAGIKPFINLSWQFKFIELVADAGYLLNPGKSLQRDSGGSLLNRLEKEVKPGWSGYRLGLGLEISLSGLQKDNSN